MRYCKRQITLYCFNGGIINSEMILRNLENYPGVKINGENMNNIRYTDDTVLIADSEEKPTKAFGYNHRKE